MSVISGSFPRAQDPGPPAPLRRASRVKALAPLAWPALVLALLLLFNLLFTPGFFKVVVQDGRLYGSLIDVLKNGSPVLLLTLGMTLVIGTGGIDLSVGATMALAGAVSACLMVPPDGSPLTDLAGRVGGSVTVVVGAGLCVALLCGVWNGVLVAFLRLQPIVATLILMVAGRGVAQLLTAGQIPNPTAPAFLALGGGYFAMLPVPVLIALVAFGGMLALVRGTALGLFVESVGNNRVAARIAGVNAGGVRLGVYAVTGLLAGVAGLIATADIQAADVNNIGLNLELDAILAAAIGGANLNGGRFSLTGSVLGALVIQLLTTTILASGQQPALALVIKAAVVVAICLLQSRKFRGLVLRRGGAA